jgi:hypothetical protein
MPIQGVIAATMGFLTYGASAQHQVEFDDRTLAHLQAVIGAKLRQRQSFFFSWLAPADRGSGRRSIWVDASIPLSFHFSTEPRIKLNRDWYELLLASANSSNGLLLIAEPEAAALTQVSDSGRNAAIRTASTL